MLRGALTLTSELLARSQVGPFEGSMRILLSDGSRLVSDMVFDRHVTSRYDSGADREVVVSFELTDWEWRVREAEPVLWCARVQGSHDFGLGNLNISFRVSDDDGVVRRSDSYHHHLFTGTERALLLRTVPERQLVCMILSSESDAWLAIDRYVLEFTLGTRLILEQFVALDGDGNVVGVSFHLSDRKPVIGSDREVVPWRMQEPWLVHFFDALVEQAASRKGLLEALLMYIDSLGDTATGCLLKMCASLSLLARIDSDRPVGTLHYEVLGVFARQQLDSSAVLEALEPDLYARASAMTRSISEEDMERLSRIRFGIYQLVSSHVGYRGPLRDRDQLSGPGLSTPPNVRHWRVRLPGADRDH